MISPEALNGPGVRVPAATGEVTGVGLFRRKKDLVDLNERSARSGIKHKDLMLLNQMVKHGADLSVPRHVLHYSYFTSREAASAAAQEAVSHQWPSEVREPLPQYPDQWALVSERPDAVLDPAFVRDSTDYFEALCQRHGGEYDGWEASI